MKIAMKYDECKKEFVKKIQRMSGKHSIHNIFNDFCHLARLSLANVFHDPKLDDEYNRILSRHDGDITPFSDLLALAVVAYESKIGDFLGECYHELGIENKNAGQFFTPYDVSYLMAKITMQKDKVKQDLEEQGYITIGDEACGAGCTLLAGLAVLKENGINYQKHVLFFARDIDDNCAAMCYVQLALLGAPAIVITGDTICNPTGGTRWFTPFYWLNRHRFEGKKIPLEDVKAACKKAIELEKAVIEPEKEPKKDENGQFLFDF